MSEMLLDGEAGELDWIPVSTIEMNSQDLTNVKVLFDKMHSLAEQLGLSLKDYEKDYRIAFEEQMGVSYLVLYIHTSYYDIVVEREALVSESIYYANPGLTNLH